MALMLRYMLRLYALTHRNRLRNCLSMAMPSPTDEGGQTCKVPRKSKFQSKTKANRQGPSKVTSSELLKTVAACRFADRQCRADSENVHPGYYSSVYIIFRQAIKLAHVLSSILSSSKDILKVHCFNSIA